MLKLQFSKAHYHTYNDGKVTICLYSCKVIDTQTKEIVTDFKVTGKAICSEKDEVNAAVGRMIADSKAKHIAYQKAQRMWNKGAISTLKHKIEQAENIINFFNQMKYLKKAEEAHIYKLCGV